MINIDYIMGLFDWNNDIEAQNRGLELAQSVKCISVFLQPGSPYGKNVWQNCATVLSMKGDEELRPYLIELLEWLQDMNWPGAFCILERLQNYVDTQTLKTALNFCLKKADMLRDDTWLANLNMIAERL